MPDMTPPAPLVEQRHRDAATGYYANAESLAMHFARFDNDRTAMLVEALREARLQLEYLDGRWPTGTTPAVVARIDAALRAQEAHGGEHYPDIQRLQLGDAPKSTG